jgi:hypothetical protein
MPDPKKFDFTSFSFDFATCRVSRSGDEHNGFAVVLKQVFTHGFTLQQRFDHDIAWESYSLRV